MDKRLVLVTEQDVNINGVLLCWAVMLATLVRQLPPFCAVTLLVRQEHSAVKEEWD